MKVYFTVDTESSLGGAFDSLNHHPLRAERHVFCRVGKRDCGIPLLVHLLKRFGFSGTFFIETLATRCLGMDDTRTVFDFLLREGQDVQLHAHPVFRFYQDWLTARLGGVNCSPIRNDFIGHLPEETQLSLLQEAVGYFESITGFRPSAFRAGCYAGSRSMLRHLASLGIRVDSSYNPCYPEVSFPQDAPTPNVVQNLEGVWEVPITVARTLLPEGYNGFKFADCTSLSFPELRQMLDVGVATGQQNFVLVFHSFSAVKPRDVTYSKMRPNRIVIRRLERLFQYLAENPRRFQVSTFGELVTRLDDPSMRPGAATVAHLGLVRSAVRKATQLVNSAYWI